MIKLNKLQLNQMHDTIDLLTELIKKNNSFKETEMLIDANDRLRKIVVHHVITKQNRNAQKTNRIQE